MTGNFSFGSADPIKNNTGTSNALAKAQPSGSGVREYKAEVRRIFALNAAPLKEKTTMTQREIADRIDVKEFALSRMFRGELTPSVQNVKDLAEIFEVTPDDLVPGYVREDDDAAVRYVQEVLASGKAYIRFEGAVTREQATILTNAVNNVMGLGQD